MAYWSSVDAQAQPIATDFPYVPHTYGQTSSLEVTLRIGEEPEQLSSAKDLQLLLLTAFSRALYRAADTGPARIMLSGHGRHLYDSDLDVSRTAGWFTAEYPLLLGPAGAGDFDSQLSGVRSALAKVPSGGIGYGLCRYMRQERSFTAARDDISFNYIGAAQRFVGRHFSSSDLLPSASIGPSLRRRRTYEVEVSGPASELSISFRYCSLIHKHETARHITGLYLDEIETSLRLLLHRIPISHTSWQEA
jgi:non-ribosomal peptide synthase protein (TIGR01720 family)